jgi:hypothetical protein
VYIVVYKESYENEETVTYDIEGLALAKLIGQDDFAPIFNLDRLIIDDCRIYGIFEDRDMAEKFLQFVVNTEETVCTRVEWYILDVAQLVAGMQPLEVKKGEWEEEENE